MQYIVTLKRTTTILVHNTIVAKSQADAEEKAADLEYEYRSDGMGGGFGEEVVEVRPADN